LDKSGLPVRHRDGYIGVLWLIFWVGNGPISATSGELRRPAAAWII
jgi:hypothetical protein